MSNQPQHIEPADRDEAIGTQRSRRSKWLARGLIAALMGVTVVQARAWFGYQQTLVSIRSTLRAHEQTANSPELTLSMVGEAARGTVFQSVPSVRSESGARQSAVRYSWNGLFKSYHLDLVIMADEEDPAVLEIVPDGSASKADQIVPAERWVRAVDADSLTIQGLLSLLSVRFELGMTPDQIAKVEALSSVVLSEIDTELMGKSAAEQQAIWQELESQSRSSFLSQVQDVLDEEQYQRLLGLNLQARGAATISWPEVSAMLNLTDEQLRQHSDILSERETKWAELNSSGERIAHKQAYEEKMLVLLNDEQVGKWNDLLGPPSSAVKPWNDVNAPD